MGSMAYEILTVWSTETERSIDGTVAIGRGDSGKV